jgi:hypothetical protein
VLPRDGFKTITVEEKVFFRFTKILKARKEANPKTSNSNFLSSLLDLYEEANDNMLLADE